MAGRAGRWGETPPEVDHIWAFPGTWVDVKQGVQVDWSGVTAVMVCLHPGCVQFGPVFDLEDVAHACLEHRQGYHAKTVKRMVNGVAYQVLETPVTLEALAAARAPRPCWNCGQAAQKLAARGVCQKCRLKLGLKWAIELGYLADDAKGPDLQALMRSLRNESVVESQALLTAYKAYEGDKTWAEWVGAVRAGEIVPGFHANRRVQEPITLPYKTEHGTRKAYKAGCRCTPCADVQSAYAAEARKRRLEKAS